jgi:hypothetical protein
MDQFCNNKISMRITLNQLLNELKLRKGKRWQVDVDECLSVINDNITAKQAVDLLIKRKAIVCDKAVV